MKAYLAECVGTFFLVFVGTGAIVVNDIVSGSVTHVGISAVFGLVVMVLIYCFGDTSGAHFNPVVTLAFASLRKFPFRKVPHYIAAQFLGALAASLVLKTLFPSHTTLGTTLPSAGNFPAFVFELLFTSSMISFIIFCEILVFLLQISRIGC
jgi:aquaporin Z